MRRNLGLLDRMIRMTLGSILVYLLLTGGYSLGLNILMAIGIVLLYLTGIFGTCLLYKWLGISNNAKKK